MTDSATSLPVEIVEVICEELISEYAKDARLRFDHRWYLLPLLSVCKLWHLVSERYLYQSIGIGSFSRRRRSPEQTAGELLLALEGNPRLAMLVKELRLQWGMHDFRSDDAHLVCICPNLRHVNLDGSADMHPSEAESLWKALAEKSLESVHICCDNRYRPVPVHALMQRWPNIRKIAIEGWIMLRSRGEADSQPSEALTCCTKLREIRIVDHKGLRKGDFRSLQMMCSAVTKLDVYVAWNDEEALVALCGCLHAWSSTLEVLRLRTDHFSTNYGPLSEALSSLTKLQSLTFDQFHFYLEAISSLPYLKYIRFDLDLISTTPSHHDAFRYYPDCSTPRNISFPPISKEVYLAHLLEDSDKFPVLTSISYWYEISDRCGELQDVCRRRNIEIRQVAEEYY